MVELFMGVALLLAGAFSAIVMAALSQAGRGGIFVRNETICSMVIVVIVAIMALGIAVIWRGLNAMSDNFWLDSTLTVAISIACIVLCFTAGRMLLPAGVAEEKRT